MKIKYLFPVLILQLIPIITIHSMSMETEEQHIKNMLITGVRTNDIEWVKNALKKGANVNMKSLKGGYTPLIESVQKEYKDIAQLLLESGANPDIQGINNNTALMIAVVNKNENITRLLLKSKANSDIQNKDGNTALIIATKDKNESIVKLLLESGANPDIQDHSGYTALMIALIKKHENSEKIAKLLLNAGTNINIQNNNGMTALMIAITYEHVNVVSLLLEINANIDLQEKNKFDALSLSALGDLEKILNNIPSTDPITKMLKEEPSRRNNLKLLRSQVKQTIQDTTPLIPELAEIVSEYAVFPKGTK